MDDLSGRDIGRYHILEPLGEGGMAKVYKAFDTHLENEVAVKVIRTDQLVPAMLEKTLKRFEREAKEVAKLSHPNIVHVIDYGDYDGMPYLVMQYLHGGTLKKLLGTPMPYQKAAALLLPIARALEYAHQHKMVHRDVKPSNILITDSGEPMLTDFGIVKMLDVEDGATLTGTGVGLGTPEYMAPEQWMGDFSPSVDQYSLGVVFYELVTGHKPYSADTPAAVLLKQASDPLPRPGSFVSNLPDNVEHVMLKALAKNPADRYASMGEFAQALSRLEQSTPTVEMIPLVQVKKPEPAAESEETQMEVPAKKPEIKPEIIPAAAAGAPIPPMQAKKVIPPPVKGKGVKPLPFILGGLGLAAVAIVIIGLTSGWFARSAAAPTLAVEPTSEPVITAPTTAAAEVKPTSAPPMPTSTTAAPAGPRLKVCMVTDAYGGIDDYSFDAVTWQGIGYAVGKFNVEARYIQSANQDVYQTNIDNFIKSGCELIVGPGWTLTDALTAAAKANPDVKFTGVDMEFNPPLPNAVDQIYQTDQASFLAGYLAAGMSKTGMVGTFGGMNIPSVAIFMDGFARGVEYYNQAKGTKVEVLGWNTKTLTGLFVDSFNDQQKGKDTTDMLINKGADVIFPVASAVGVGALDAIWPYGGKVWFIGVDSDWSLAQPKYKSYILTSVVKAMDVSTFIVIASVQDGTFKGGTYVGTLANGGVGIATPNEAVPAELLTELAQVKADIIAGKIKFNSTYKIQ